MKKQTGTYNIKGKQISNLITKFYFKNDNLKFLILLKLKGNTIIPFEEYNDYSTYRDNFNNLLEVRNKNLSLRLPAHRA